MRRTLTLLCLAVLAAGCASAPRKAEDPQKRRETARLLRQAFEAGRGVGASDPTFTLRLEEASLGWLLYRGPAPYAGARRLLDLKERQPQNPLVPVLIDGPDAPAVAALQQEEGFRTGLFFNSYDPALFRPFFRHALLSYLKDPGMDDAAFLGLMEPLEIALKLTPRFGGVYPNHLADETRSALEAWLKDHPTGVTADRMAMLLAWDRRNLAWASDRQVQEDKLRALAEATQDELLRLEIRDGLTAPQAKPEKAFWMSLLLPGLGQIAYGDIQGGVLLGGLTLSSWIWAGSRLAAGQASGDATTRQAAFGDAAYGAALALLGHGFTAMNAAEQARQINIVIEWDTLSKDRLGADEGKDADAPKPDDAR